CFPLSRSASQLPKVHPHPNSNPPLPGGDTEYRARKSVSFGGTTVINKEEVLRSSWFPRAYDPSGDISVGLHGLLHFHCPERQ
ncbi:hypothetical protein NDU88_005359, partial [Pleurodeles waltl]